MTFVRKCAICGVRVSEGYYHEEFGVYFCSDEHLEQQWNGILAELEKMDDDDLENSPIYWTDWR